MAKKTPIPGPQWFSIKQACGYLGIGEPTMYRWMREGKITYRKIGDSTRFLQEDLDALVEVHPSKKDATRVREFCPVCHGTELVEGVVRSTGLIYFQPKKTKFWTLRDSNVALVSRMCAQCGAVFQFGNVEKLASLRASALTDVDEGEPAAADE